MQGLNNALASQAKFGPTILRVLIGLYLLWHGIDKFQTGISNVEGFFSSQGVPLAALTAPLTAVAEIVIGIALIIGLGTRLAAFAGFLILVGALIFVHWSPVADGGIIRGSERDMMYIAGLACLTLLGGGALSADQMLKQDDTLIDVRSTKVASNAPAEYT